MINILNPVAAPRRDPGQRLPLVPALSGLNVGILTNHWKSMDRMARRMETKAKETYSASMIRTYDIPINGAMTEETERRVRSECDVAIVGLAN